MTPARVTDAIDRLRAEAHAKNCVVLTPKQRQVVRLICADKTNAEIAEVLGTSKVGVEKLIARTRIKLGIEPGRTRGAYWRALAGVKEVDVMGGLHESGPRHRNR